METETGGVAECGSARERARKRLAYFQNRYAAAACWRGGGVRENVFFFFFFFFKCRSLYFPVVVSAIVIYPLSNKIHYFFHAVLQCSEASA